MSANSWGVRFADKEAFGSACMILTSHGHTFALAGFQTIVLAEDVLRAMGPDVRDLFQASPSRVEVFPIERHGKRPGPPTPSAISAMLKEFSKR